MEAADPPRNKNHSQSLPIEIIGTVIALTTLITPILLINNFSNRPGYSSLEPVLLLKNDS